MDLALNYLQRLIRYKTQPTKNLELKFNYIIYKIEILLG